MVTPECLTQQISYFNTRKAHRLWEARSLNPDSVTRSNWVNVSNTHTFSAGLVSSPKDRRTQRTDLLIQRGPGFKSTWGKTQSMSTGQGFLLRNLFFWVSHCPSPPAECCVSACDRGITCTHSGTKRSLRKPIITKQNLQIRKFRNETKHFTTEKKLKLIAFPATSTSFL